MRMESNSDILDLLRAESIKAERKAQRALIIQPGAIGDSILTLPLAAFLKDTLHLGGVDVLGHTEYIGILPGRTCINRISSIDSLDLHRLFREQKTFNLADHDPLLHAFSGYVWIVTFMGEPGGDFEQNLIFAANCTHSTEVVTLSLNPPEDFRGHLTDYYIQQFVSQSGLSIQARNIQPGDCFIEATYTDLNEGGELLKEIGLDPLEKPVIIHPGSGASNKCWHIDNFLAVAQELLAAGTKVLFLLGPAECEKFSAATMKKVSNVTQCLSDLSFSQVVRLLSCANGFIGNDSGITHLAAMLGIRTIAVFGPTNPDIYKPIGKDVSVIADRTANFSKKPSLQLQHQLLDMFMA
jgi:heptosyltransferase-3